MPHGVSAVEDAQADVLRALEELRSSIYRAGESTTYLNEEVTALDNKMRALEKAVGMVYVPFRACLYEYAAEHRTGNCHRKAA